MIRYRMIPESDTMVVIESAYTCGVCFMSITDDVISCFVWHEEKKTSAAIAIVATATPLDINE